MDIEKTIDMLKNCSAIQIEDFRRILQYIYMGISNIAEYMYDDIENLKTLKVGVDEIVDKLDKIDAIQKLQFKWLSGSLDTIINKLQGGQNAEIE